MSDEHTAEEHFVAKVIAILDRIAVRVGDIVTAKHLLKIKDHILDTATLLDNIALALQNATEARAANAEGKLH